MAVRPLAGVAKTRPLLRVGCVSVDDVSAPRYAAFLSSLESLGFEQGQNLDFEFVRVSSPNERGFSLGWAEVIQRDINMLLADGPEACLTAAIKVSGSLPIVMVANGFDPIAKKYISNGSGVSENLTGLYSPTELTAKRLQLLKDTLPDLTAATIFWDQFSADQWQTIQPAAASLGIRLHGVELHDAPYDFEAALDQVPPDSRGSLVVLDSPNFAQPVLRRLPAFALRHGIPSMFANRAFVTEGGLLSYGPNVTETYKAAAEYVNRLARGEPVSSVPAQRSTQFEFSVNLSTAKKLGIVLPLSVTARADHLFS
ncbi:MAG: ABC transporter substrate-binding protein [Burkholderiaceae bacterium]